MLTPVRCDPMVFPFGSFWTVVDNATEELSEKEKYCLFNHMIIQKKKQHFKLL